MVNIIIANQVYPIELSWTTLEIRITLFSFPRKSERENIMTRLTSSLVSSWNDDTDENYKL